VTLPGGLRLTLAVATPGVEAGETFVAQAEAALEAVSRAADSGPVPASPVHLVVFVTDDEHIHLAQACVRSAFRHGGLPAVSYVAQPPLPRSHGGQVAIEAWCLGAEAATHLAIRHPGEGLVEIETATGASCVLASRIGPRPYTTGVFNETVSALSNLRVQLKRSGVGFESIVRTWYYLGSIVDDEAPGGPQRYKELNRARAAYYDGVSFLGECVPPGLATASPVYPASTGIGTGGRSLWLAALAIKHAPAGLVTVPIENPSQTAAFAYADRYGPKSPQFARAMAVAMPGQAAAIIVSGTASIIASESRHLGDVRAQTHQTLDNIATLVAEPNLARHGLTGLGATLDDLAQVRVYVKRPDDCAAVAAACRERLGAHVPILYVQADVCRPDLLVEIEGVAFTRVSRV
jgi:enamine deaminase RidA (YjgF/YER057c/UK114 family)